MDPKIVDLIDALRERLAIVGDEQSRRDVDAHMKRLQSISERIDRLQNELPSPLDPELAHYLQRRSYSKALEYLVGAIDLNRPGDSGESPLP